MIEFELMLGDVTTLSMNWGGLLGQFFAVEGHLERQCFEQRLPAVPFSECVCAELSITGPRKYIAKGWGQDKHNISNFSAEPRLCNVDLTWMTDLREYYHQFFIGIMCNMTAVRCQWNLRCLNWFLNILLRLLVDRISHVVSRRLVLSWQKK
jgi:hypothetical protein